MFTLSGYQTQEQLYESEQSLIFRAAREPDGLRVVLKVLKDAQPTPERIARFKREYLLLKELDLPGVVKAHELVNAAGHWLFIQEDFGGESLARLGLAGRMEIGELLPLACDIAGHLASVHQRTIVHKDVNPSNIVLDRRSGVVKLIDFGISTRLAREPVAFHHPSLIEGTPAYLAPEQTGRINQPLDHRADLYALGCTLYELCAGRPPFDAKDLIELVHCHLARAPEPLDAIRPGVPKALSAIITKLMAKSPADRYQSANGLLADLIRCRDEQRSAGVITSFALGANDVAERLSPPPRLYGREREVGDLLSAFERVAGGGTELVLVTGPSGAGKSALVKELYLPVTRGRGSFVAGKFDQFQRDTPYRPILEALDSLIRQVLMEPPAAMASWASSVSAAAGKMLPALMEILPRLEALCGRPAPAPSMPAIEARHRFVEALTGTIRAFARAEHPLVLFIDDLQWADSASLDLLKHLMTGAPIPHLLILGAYRDHEVGPAHPLRTTIKEIRAAGVAGAEHHLPPLTLGDTAALVADTLRPSAGDQGAMASVVHQKTGGNPFFIHTFLDALATRGVVSFDRESSSWRWDDERLRLLDVSDNVVDLLIAGMQALPPPARALLTQASCIGNQFELGLLAAVAESTPGEVATSLLPALNEHYLIPVSGDYRLLEADVEGLDARLRVAYKFAHDRVQQAAYGLSAPGTHAAIHLRIGRSMRAYYAEKSADTALLTIVGQLNQAEDLIQEERERDDVAALNLQAGRRARAAVANAAALGYFEQGIKFLVGGPAEPGKGPSPELLDRAFAARYTTALALSEGAAEAANLIPDFATADKHIDAVLRHADRPADRLKVVQVRVNACSAQYRLPDAVAAAREVVEPLGIKLEVDPTDEDVEAWFGMVAKELGSRAPIALAELPEMKNEEQAAVMRVLHSIYLPIFLMRPKLGPLVAAQMVLLTIRHGLCENSVHGFLFYGMSLCSLHHWIEGNEFGRAAEVLVERHQRKAEMPDLATAGWGYIFHFQRPMRDAIPVMRAGYRAGLESGFITSGANCLQGSAVLALLSGCPLPDIDEEYAEGGRALEQQKQGPFLTWLRQYHQAVRNLRGLNDDPTRLQGDVYDEQVNMPIHVQFGDQSAIFNVGYLRSILCYHFHDTSEAVKHARSVAGQQAGSVLGTVSLLYYGLSLLAHCDAVSAEERAALLDEAAPLVERMRRWGEACPVNYAHKYHLMAAELARVKGAYVEARDHYDKAIDLAHKHEFLHEEGLSEERAALFFLQHDNPRLAGHYMRDAYYTYGVWGSDAKRDFLRRRYGHLLEREARGRDGGARRSTTTTTSDLGDLDLSTVLAATRAVARENDAARLLETVMRVSLENAGAERGFLILARGEELIVKARGELGAEATFAPVSTALNDQEGIARSVVRYVARTAEPVLLGDAAAEGMFVSDPHVRATACKSLLCVPVLAHGELIAVSYLENNHAANVFNHDRLDVLTLVMGQAAVSIENALLKASGEEPDMAYRAGGSLPADSPTYVRRQADELLARYVKRGELCYVFNTRQMGKSSLRVRAADRSMSEDVASVSVDLTSIGARDVSAEQWYAGVARALLAGLGLSKDIDLRSWWRDEAHLSPVQRLDALFEVILARIQKPIAIFIDEVDAVLGLPFSPDDFFALIRSLYNRRADDPKYARLTFVLLGVATPADLIRDPKRTPFNIGRAVPLNGFRFDEAQNLVPGLRRAGDGEALLRAVLDWSGGQPFLTQKLCRLIVEAESTPLGGKERAWVSALVHDRVIEQWRRHDEPEHLKTIEARILHAEDSGALLSLYQSILDAGEMDATDSPEETALLLSGLVTRAFDKLRVGNPIYAAVFNEAWIKASLARASRPHSASKAPSP